MRILPREDRNRLIEAGHGKFIYLIDKGRCPFCKKKIYTSEFRSASSRLQYLKGTPICQRCQDERKVKYKGNL